MQHSTGAPTLAQRERFDLLFQIGCIVCLVYIRNYRAPDISHELEGGVRMGHDFTIPECCWHHRAVPPDGYTEVTARRILGASRADGSKLYAAQFGDDACLREMTEAAMAKVIETKATHKIGVRPPRPEAPIDSSKWTLVEGVYVRTKSVRQALLIAGQVPRGERRGTINKTQWMRAAEFEKAVRK